MSVDKVDEGLEVTTSGIVSGVVLQFAPRREQDQFWVAGTAAFLEVAGCERQRLQCVSSAGQSDAVTSGEQVHDLGHGADVRTTEDRVRVGDVANFGGDGLAASQANGASASSSQRLACSARRGPKRNDWVSVRCVASKPVITSRAPRQP